jgi:catecholate siderophore receptor
MFAAVDNTVTLPGFTRFDGGLYVGITRGLRAQINVENIFDTKYYPTSNGNNNIAPGSPREARLSLSASF